MNSSSKYDVTTATTTSKSYVISAPGPLDALEEMIAEVRKHLPDDVVEDGTPISYRVEGSKIIVEYQLSRTSH